MELALGDMNGLLLLDSCIPVSLFPASIDNILTQRRCTTFSSRAIAAVIAMSVPLAIVIPLDGPQPWQHAQYTVNRFKDRFGTCS
jgi:hypothetical protein